MKLLHTFLTLFCLSLLSLQATIQLPAIFGDNMVLQAGKPLPFWGTAEPGEKITVAINGPDGALSQGTATADADGKWKAKLPECPSGKEVTVSVTGSTSEPVTFANVLTGEVWVCSGQSNMGFAVNRTSNVDSAVQQADNPKIRLFTVEKNTSGELLDDVEGKWVVCTRQNALTFSAVGFFFGLELYQYLQQPIGLIHTAWGGTPVEAWTPMDALENEPGASEIIENYKRFQADPDSVLDEKGKPLYRNRNQCAPSWLYNAMVHPLVPYAIAGAIWYQGESNARNPEEYKTTFPLMIETWRARWGQGDFPFLYVELAGYHKKQSQPIEDGWPYIREAQAEALKLPNTGVATAVDVGEEKDIHPKNKAPVGARLALVAEGMVYGKEDLTQSPRFKSSSVKDGKVVVKLSDADEGLVYTPVDGISGFAIRGLDGEWQWADVTVDGSTLIVSNANITDPVAVRYAWASFPILTVTSKQGLPLLPFRTDPDSKD